MTDSGLNTPSSAQRDGFSYRSLLRNYTSLSGVALAVLALANIIILVLIDVTASQPNPYTGILAYMVLPVFLVAGLILTVTGMLCERDRRFIAASRDPLQLNIDLSQPRQQNGLIFFGSIVAVFTLLSAFGSYRL